MFSDTARKWHMWTHSSYDSMYKTHASSCQTKPQHTGMSGYEVLSPAKEPLAKTVPNKYLVSCGKQGCCPHLWLSAGCFLGPRLQKRKISGSLESLVSLSHSLQHPESTQCRGARVWFRFFLHLGTLTGVLEQFFSFSLTQKCI